MCAPSPLSLGHGASDRRCETTQSCRESRPVSFFARAKMWSFGFQQQHLLGPLHVLVCWQRASEAMQVPVNSQQEPPMQQMSPVEHELPSGVQPGAQLPVLAQHAPAQAPSCSHRQRSIRLLQCGGSCSSTRTARHSTLLPADRAGRNTRSIADHAVTAIDAGTRQRGGWAGLIALVPAARQTISSDEVVVSQTPIAHQPTWQVAGSVGSRIGHRCLNHTPDQSRR